MDPIKPLEELMNQYFPEQDYVVQGLMPAGAITILSGAPRSYKTYTLLDIAIAVSRGAPLFGEFTTTQQGVLIVDEENDERLIQKRLFQLGATADLPIYFTPHKGFKLTDEDVENVILSCQTYDIGLVIFDSLIRIHTANENSANEMAEVFKYLRRFTEKNITVLVTQHNRKPGTNYAGAGNEMRGSTDILAAVDCHISVVRKDKFYLTFEQTKQRYDIELEQFEVKANVDDDGFQFEYLGLLKPQASKGKLLSTAVFDLLNEHGELSQKELLEKLTEVDMKTSDNTLRPFINRWVNEGRVIVNPGAGKTKLYSLNPGGDYEAE